MSSIYIYVYIYIYMCECVCVRVYFVIQQHLQRSDPKWWGHNLHMFKQPLLTWSDHRWIHVTDGRLTRENPWICVSGTSKNDRSSLLPIINAPYLAGCPCVSHGENDQKDPIDLANLGIPKGKSAASISLIHCGYFSSTSFSVMAQTPGHFTKKYGDIVQVCAGMMGIDGIWGFDGDMMG